MGKTSNPITVKRFVGSCNLIFLVEPTFEGFFHACTIDDICHVLSRVPEAHLQGIALIVLRQPKRKEKILNPAWGRFIYYYASTGSAICIEAQNPNEKIKWKNLHPSEMKEIDRLKADGHTITLNRRECIIERTPEAIRATQLYRTLLHEIGHYVDWFRSVLQKTSDELDDEYISNVYDRKTSLDKETFAHRYANELRASLFAEGFLPFDRVFNPDQIEKDGLNVEWFQYEKI
ncbi:MAG: hypothetical protein HC887_06470 [Desulfobacteraceae bacterium]|nr:hypothetical protein [Desulfobacteraceae bacterium]